MTVTVFTQLYDQAAPFCLIDCRERRDYVHGHWFGSTNIPLSILPTRLPFLCPDFGFPIHYLDWGDTASSVALAYMRDMGYHNITSHKTAAPTEPMTGFVQGEYVWSKAFGEIVSHLPGILEVTPQQYLADHPDAQLVDVRPAGEYNRFTLPGSKNLPNSLLLANMDALRRHDTTVLLHCAGRTRSIIGAHTLQAAGYEGDFAIFRGGTQAWELDGFTREHGATQNIAAPTESIESVANFLDRWQIRATTIRPADLDAFIESHRDHLLFDVSDDAANGDLLAQRVIKISGTNLVQQTDRSIARYHVPIILFDTASGCRAAFAAYWLSRMGFAVEIAIIAADSFAAAPQHPTDPISAKENPIPKWLASGTHILDFRLSKDYASAHIATSKWENITTIIDQQPAHQPVGIIATCAATGNMIADILTKNGWQIDAIAVWADHAIEANLQSTAASISDTGDSPIDQSALFAGRHFGVLKDAQDYLDWEEDLPGLIPATIKTIWQDRLQPKTND